MMTDPMGARMQHEVGADFQVRLPMFSGRNDDWPVWSARFGEYAELAGRTAVLEVSEAQTASISMVGASPEAIRLGKIIFAVLLTKTEGMAFSIVHLTPRGAGAEAWRLLQRGVCWVDWCQVGKHGTRSCMPKGSMDGRCERW